MEKYQRWSKWQPEEDGVLVAYASIYGHTENAAEVFAMALRDAGVNGTWAPAAGKQMREILGSMKNMRVLEPVPTIRSALAADTREALTGLARQLAEA